MTCTGNFRHPDTVAYHNGPSPDEAFRAQVIRKHTGGYTKYRVEDGVAGSRGLAFGPWLRWRWRANSGLAECDG